MKENIHEFEDAIIPHIGWIKNQVEEKGQIAMKLSDLANQLGPKFENKSEFILYLAMKYILYAEGIVVIRGDEKEKGIIKLRFNEDYKKHFEWKF